MAIGDSDVSICNDALLLLGAEGITSFTDGTTAGSLCNSFYSRVKNLTLSMYPWSFSLAKRELTQDSGSPTTEWTYQYLLPGDLITHVPRAVRTSSAAGAAEFKDWDINGFYLMTDATTIFIDYQKDVAEASLPAYFVQLLIYQMTWHLAEPVTDQTTKGDYWRAIAIGNPSENGRGGFFRQAANIDGSGQTPNFINDYPLTAVR